MRQPQSSSWIITALDKVWSYLSQGGGVNERLTQLETQVSSLQSALNNKVDTQAGVARDLNIYQSSAKSGKALMSRVADARSLSALFDELRILNGGIGSCSITGISPMPTTEAWYHYIYIPHRSGGNYGQETGDNHQYGTLLLFHLNTLNKTFYVAHYINGNITVYSYP